MPSFVIETWGRVAVLTVVLVVAYAWLVAVLRVSGTRTLAKLNAFDFVVTIALGSTLATVVLSRDVPLIEALTAMLGLVVLQYVVARASRRWNGFDAAVKSQPTALLVDGRLRPQAMAKCRVRADEVAAAVRKEGIGSFTAVACVILETDGTFSVLEHDPVGTVRSGVEGLEEIDDAAAGVDEPDGRGGDGDGIPRPPRQASGHSDGQVNP
jgi:uncharacterized membrane protein YcaP (DUF421 family)